MKLKFVIILFAFITMSMPVLAQTGDVQGTVYQQSTGKSLAAADVRITETDQSQKTDENGIFRFTELPEGTYTFVVTHPLEPQPTEISVDISSGDTIEVKIHLGPAFKLETVVVEGRRLPPTVSRTEIRGSELLRIPGTTNDALKGLMTLPSIGIPNDYLGILYIRGSGPSDTIYYLDRTPFGYPFHYGGLVSTINSDIIEDIHIYAGGYGAEFGLDSQTVLDIRSRDRTDKRRLSGKFNLNVLYSEGMLEGRIGDKGYFHVAGRRSYFDFIAGVFLEDLVWPYFSDYQVKFVYELAENHHLTVNAFGTNDHFHIRPSATVISDFSAYFRNGFEAQGIHLRSEFTENLTSNISFTHAFTFLNTDFEAIFGESFLTEVDGREIEPELISQRSIYNNIKVNVPIYTLRGDVSYQLTPKFQFEPGVLFTFSPAKSFGDRGIIYEGLTDSDIFSILHEDEELMNSDNEFYQIIRPDADRDEFWYDFRRSEGYLQGRYDPLSFLSLALGIRFDYFNLTEELSVQPRGSLSIKLSNNATLRFAYGTYEQSPLAYQVLAENGNRDLKSSTANHYIMEFEHDISSQTELKLATYYKGIRDLVTANQTERVNNVDAQIAPNYLNQGTGFIGGAEAFLRHRVNEKFFGWFSYTWTHREQRTHPAAPYEPHIFDNTHIISLVGNYSISPTFEIGGKWQYSSGTTGAHVSEILLIQDPITRGMQPIFTDVQGVAEIPLASLPSYHRLDLRVSKTWDRKGWQIGGFLEILNVYNRKNTIKFYNPAGDGVQEAPQLPIIPYGGLTIEF
ncbi:MAG: TonB-dependent receptor [Candidatus Poribacteria bacterium]|nr:TonB-dependent receptor [Candidatus Poribacteria bacterium]